MSDTTDTFSSDVNSNQDTSGEQAKKDDSNFSFLKSTRQKAKKRGADERKIDFKEIYFDNEESNLREQSDRCLDCGNPYCEWKCPLHNYIPNWLNLVANKEFQQAAETMYQTNPLPEVCGRVCPQDRLCEQACTLQTGFGAVTIGAIEKAVTDKAIANKWRPDYSHIKPSNKKVAIVGAGPAGLACADFLVRHGIKPVVYDKYPEIGGLLTFGIPGFKLEKEVMQQRREFLQDLGVQFKLNTDVGKDITFESLQSDYDALFLGMGAYTPVAAKLQGSDALGMYKALDYLIGNTNHLYDFKLANFPFIDLKGKRVLVLGGGDTTMDCVRTAIRQGASEVSCVYRRDEASMPGSANEVKNAKEEGVNFIFNASPLEIVTDKEGPDSRVSGLKSIKTRTLLDTATGQEKLASVEGSEFLIEADAIITAFGFRASPETWFESTGLNTHDSGLLQVKENAQANESPTNDFATSQLTSLPNVYAGGDMVRGADLVVTAIADGRKAAQEIAESLLYS